MVIWLGNLSKFEGNCVHALELCPSITEVLLLLIVLRIKKLGKTKCNINKNHRQFR